MKIYKKTLIILIIAFASLFLLTFCGYMYPYDLEFGQTFLIKDESLFNFTRIYTKICNPIIATILVTIIALIFFAFKKWSSGIFVALSAGMGAALNHFLKEQIMFDRPPYRLIEEVGYTFPSGHSNAAAAIAVSLFIILQNSNFNNRIKRVLTVFLSFFAISVALSRVMLGVHYLSDILSGLVLGSSVAILIYLIMIRFSK